MIRVSAQARVLSFGFAECLVVSVRGIEPHAFCGQYSALSSEGFLC